MVWLRETITSYDLTKHFITGAFDYYECSVKENTGLNDIVEDIVFAGLGYFTKRKSKIFAWPWKRYHMTSCDHYMIFVVNTLDTAKAAE